jgi:mono/diheme cytochrome c family protein
MMTSIRRFEASGTRSFRTLFAMATIGLGLFLFLTSFAFADSDESAALDPALVAKGQKLFKPNCAICHGAKGEGNGPSAASLTPKPRNFQKDPFKFGETYVQILTTIGNGIPNSAMPSWKESLGEADLKALAAYIKSIRMNLASKGVKSASSSTKSNDKK